MQWLSFGNASFEPCTSTEVFERLPEDELGFAETRRVLAAGGAFICAVPLSGGQTLERAVLKEGGFRHLVPPAAMTIVFAAEGKSW